MESIKIRKTKKKNTEKKRRKRRKRIEIKRKIEVISPMRRSFMVFQGVKMGRKSQMRIYFLENLKVKVGTSLFRKRKIGIKTEAVPWMRRSMLDNFWVIMGKRLARIAISLKISGILNLCKGGGSEMKVQELGPICREVYG